VTGRPTYDLDGRLGKLIVRGARLKGDVAEAVTSATLSLSSTEATQLDITLVDDGWDVLRSGLFSAGTPTKAGSRCDFANLDLEVRAIEVAPRGVDNALRITARSLGVGKLKRARGALVRKNLTPSQFVKLEAKRAGLKCIAQPSPKRKSIARQTGKDAETSWDTCQRLAKELGYVCFEAAGTLYFGRPTWLTERTKELRVTWKGAKTDGAIDALPTCRRSGDDRKLVATVEAMLRGDLGEDARPGMALILAGVPTFDGRYMVDTVTLPLAEEAAATVSASTPENPKPEPPPKKKKSSPGKGKGGKGVDDSSSGGAKSAAAFVGYALAQAGDTYIYGAEASVSDPNPNAFDCSELVQWAAGRAGVPFTDGSSAQIAACRSISVEQAIRTKGALLWHPGHIAISLGNGRTIEAANSRVGVVSYNAASRFQRGGLIPGMRY
jgi:cell wall-associated NlpC family hydrolase